MTVHREHKVKRENQQDATNSMFIIKQLSNSNFHTVHTAHDAAPQDHSQPQPTQPVQNTICSSTRSCSPDDRHNDARNMLR